MRRLMTPERSARLRRKLNTWVLRLAAAAGVTVRYLSVSGPGVFGAAFVAYGLGLIYRPMLFLAVGIFLLILDRRTS